ncbi:MAG: arsenic transporter [Actinobacteria bacterium]|nr:arsenic transporter [Actinomycetota bacterium]
MTPALGLAAVLAVATGFLPWPDAVATLERIWPVLAFLVAVTVVAELADAAGLFEVAAARAARLARGRVLALWLLVVALATATTVLLSLDTTAVLLTPVVLALAARLGLSPVPFAMTTVWLANTASLLLPVSNLTNLLAVERVGWSAARWAGQLWAPALVCVAVPVAVLWLLHRRELGGRYAVAAPGGTEVDDVPLLRLAGLVCAGLGVAVAAGAPPWAAAGAAAVVLLAAFGLRRREALTTGLAPVGLVVTTVSIFLVVAALDEHGLATLLRDAAGTAGAVAPSGFVDALRVTATGAVSSNVVNNLPAYLAVEGAVHAGPGSDPTRLLALVVGTNAGPLVTVWASLATLLWRSRCRARGVRISALRFAAEGLACVVPMLVLATAVLVITR